MYHVLLSSPIAVCCKALDQMTLLILDEMQATWSRQEAGKLKKTV